MSHRNSKTSLWEVPANFYLNGNINKDACNREIDFPIIKINNFHIKTVMKIFKRFSPELNNFDKLVPIESDKNAQGILIDPQWLINIDSELNDREKSILRDLNEEFPPIKVEFHTKSVKYDNYRLATLIKWLLPSESVLTAFTVTGHIVHLNLRQTTLPYKHAIGTLLLDKVPLAKCVVSKVNKIDTEFRTFQLDLLAGEPLYVTKLKEHGSEFALDFSKVYWNSRLSTEHAKICSSLVRSDVIYDACAGIGPFAIPAAKKGCRVIANDLNEESVKWLRHNMLLNSTKKRKIDIDVHNMDARDFIKKIVICDILQHQKSHEEPSRFFLIMNLPSIAIDFLSAIVEEEHSFPKPTVLSVRCYCFIGKDISRETIESKISEQLYNKVDNVNLRFVRNVAPNKDMFCAEISVTLSSSSSHSQEEVVSKKIKLFDN